MIGLDTNVLVRFFVQDDRAQSRKADALLQTLSTESPGFVSLVTLIELSWVMRSSYRMTRQELAESLESLLNSPEIVVENEPAVTQALQRFVAAKADFADALIERSGHVAGCSRTVTFDTNAARLAGMTML
jgi:predicted nucleic-acid-binding protein